MSWSLSRPQARQVGHFWTHSAVCNSFRNSIPHGAGKTNCRCVCPCVAAKRHCNAPETISHLNNEEFATLPALRAQTGLQSKASKLPPLIPTYASKVALTGYQMDLPQWDLHKKCTSPLKVLTTNAPTVLPKGSKLLHISPSMLPESCLQGGVLFPSSIYNNQILIGSSMRVGPSHM